MHLLKGFCVLCFLICGCSISVHAQARLPTMQQLMKVSVEKTLVKNVVITGNKKTKEFVIIREMGIGPGDSIPISNISSFLDRIKLNLLNTKIFNDIQLNIRNWDDSGLEIHVHVVEKFNIIPIPFIQLADRNLNEWWVDRGKDFKRIQYGATLNWGNFRGRNETLSITASLGFAHLLDINYYMPNLSKNGKLGASFNVSMMQSKRMAYATRDNKLQFIYQDNFIKRGIDIAPRLILHRNLQVKHYIEARYSYRWVDDLISDLNKDYFLNGANKQSAISLEYGFDIDRRTLRAYPTSGYQIEGTLTNYGMGLQRQVNMTTLTVAGSKFFTFDRKNKHSTGHLLKFKGSYPRKQPYNIQSGMGYDQDFVRGYEYYVIDGQSFTLMKNEYRYQLAAFRFGARTNGKKQILKQALPFDIYIKAFFDAGYVEDKYFNEKNTLQNRWMVGSGVGIDVLMLYDKVIRVEYSLNRMKEHGLYFHMVLPF